MGETAEKNATNQKARPNRQNSNNSQQTTLQMSHSPSSKGQQYYDVGRNGGGRPSTGDYRYVYILNELQIVLD